MKKLVVCGATGTQGGSLIEVMKDQHGWELYAFSRDPNSDRAKKLQSQGVKVSKADLMDLESLTEVFRDAGRDRSRPRQAHLKL